MCKKKWLFSSRKLFKKLFLVFLMVVPLFFISHISAMSLEKAVFQTLHTNPELKEKEQSLEGVKQERDIVLSGYYPKLYVSSGFGTAKEEITPAYRESGEEVTRTDHSITASMNLFNGFYTYYDAQSQEHRTDAAKSYLNEYQTAVTMQTVESYISMMKQKAIVQISKENVISHKEIHDKLKEYTDSGMGKASDLKFASGRLTLAKVNAVVHENNFIQSKVVFETVLGGSVDIDELEEPVFDYTLPKTLEDAALIALDYNPSIQVGEHNIKSAHSNYKRSQSIYYPSIDIEIKKSWFDEKNGYDYSVNSSHAMVYLNYNLFNGFSDTATVEKEFTSYLQNDLYLLYTKRDVTRKLGIAWISAVKIQEQLELLEKMRIDSKNTLEDYYKEFLFGRRTLLDIINVKNDFDNSRQSYEAAKYDLLLAKFRILDAMGGSLDYFLAKADKMELTEDENFVESMSIYDIIKQMNDKLQNKEEFIIYDESNYTSFDAMMEEHENQENELDELEKFDSIEFKE